MTRQFPCSKEKSKKTFNPFAYAMVFRGLKVHDLSIAMTSKETKKVKKLIIYQGNHTKMGRG